MLRIGLTGGIGSGKSTVATLFAELGAPVVDTDEISRALAAPGQLAVEEIIRAFGPTVRDPSGGLDRAVLRRLVFEDSAQRQRLEAILHPLIRRETERRVAALRAPYVVIVAPLLLEAGFVDLVDRVLVVDANETDQIERVRRRSGLAEPEIRRILAAQLSRAARRARADDLIVNDSDTAHLTREVRRLDQQYRAAAASR
jgi:dephospho-CoA kinase